MADPLRPKPRWRGVQARERKILVALDDQEHEAVRRGLDAWNERRSTWERISLSTWARHVLLLAAEQELHRGDLAAKPEASSHGLSANAAAAIPAAAVRTKPGDRQTKRRNQEQRRR